MNIFYISDLHFGHAAIIRLCKRPFSCVEEMDEIMTENWNKYVKKNDLVYVAGDFAYKNKISAATYLKRLNGRKILVRGNHDKEIETSREARSELECVLPITHTFDPACGGHYISICHYPLLIWPGKNESLMIFGHIHNDTKGNHWLFIKYNERLLNAGADINGFKPVTLDELIENNKIFKEQHE